MSTWPPQLPLPLHVVVSTTTSGWTTISCDDVHDGGSSVMVVSEMSEPRNRRVEISVR